MEILVKMQVILQNDNGNLNLHLYERTNEILAETEERLFSIDDLCEYEYEAHGEEIQGVECELVKLSNDDETIFICATVEDFEETLTQLGLSKEEEESESVEEASSEEIDESLKVA